MAENEVQYASVVFKNKQPPRAKKEEEVVYDEVKTPYPTAQQTSNTNGLLSDKEAERSRWYQKLACCFGGLCVILVMAGTGVSVYFLYLHKSDERELKQLKTSQSLVLEENINLTNLNNKLNKDFNIQVENLTQLNHKLSNINIQVHNLTQEKQNLTTELGQVKNKNQDLQTEKEKLTKEIKTLNKTWNEQNVSRAQQIIDEYCPKDTNNVRRCSSCQRGWTHYQSSCYVVNNAKPADQKTWEEARETCRGSSSDLTVVGDEEEKKFVDGTSWTDSGINGYWIGLRAEGGKWKWIDGSDLTNQAWMQQQPAADGQCVTSLQNRGWKPVRCNDRNAWICEKKPLTV
ncbi:uncharacterized protein FYW61_006647 [Anableps anableps]